MKQTKTVLPPCPNPLPNAGKCLWCPSPYCRFRYDAVSQNNFHTTTTASFLTVFFSRKLTLFSPIPSQALREYATIGPPPSPSLPLCPKSANLKGLVVVVCV